MVYNIIFWTSFGLLMGGCSFVLYYLFFKNINKNDDNSAYK